MRKIKWGNQLLSGMLVFAMISGNQTVLVNAQEEMKEEKVVCEQSIIEELAEEQQTDGYYVEIPEETAEEDKTVYDTASEEESLTQIESEQQDDSEDCTVDDEEQILDITSSSLLASPRVVPDTSMNSGQKVTYDCIWLGSYPSREIVAKVEDCYTYGRQDHRKTDYLVDSSLFNTLKSISGWDGRNEIKYGETKYRRLLKNTSTENDYRYFKYEPIKWRVLDVSDNKVFLLADKALDGQRYHDDEDRDAKASWMNSTLRSWLNGYDAGKNKLGTDYRGIGFIDCAFSDEEKSLILDTKMEAGFGSGDSVMSDKVFLLSMTECSTANEKTYGFSTDGDVLDEARILQSSAYAKAKGLRIDAEEGEDSRDLCWWWLRDRVEDDVAPDVYYFGGVTPTGCGIDNIGGVRPAVNIDASTSSDLWRIAGTVCSDGTVDEKNSPDDNTLPENNKKVFISSIVVSGISNKIAAGKKVQLMANIAPTNATNKAVTWTSSNQDVATVDDNGLVSVKVKTGGKSVVITATAKDGSGKTATFNITSMKGAVKSIKLSGKKTVKPGKSLKLKATVKTTKGKVNKKLKWTSSNPNLATVSSSGKVKTFKGKKGKAKITVMATDGTNKKKSVTIKIK